MRANGKNAITNRKNADSRTGSQYVDGDRKCVQPRVKVAHRSPVECVRRTKDERGRKVTDG